MKVLLTHPTGNENVRAAARGFMDAGILAGFNTTVATFPGNAFDIISSFAVFKEFKRRHFDVGLKPVTKAWPFLELGRLAASKMGLKSLSAPEKGIFSVDSIYKNLDKQVAKSIHSKLKNEIDAVFSYEDGALFSFREAKKSGIKCLYDLPIGYWRTARKLLSVEYERYPDWVPTLNGLNDSVAKLARKDEELQLADKIFVASTFTANTLKDYPGKLAPVKIIPYGFPACCLNRVYRPLINRPLKVLFVGKLSQRKGIADLFSVVDNIGEHIELTVVGTKTDNPCVALDIELAKHTWIPSLPHSDILKIMGEHDVLVFPSLFEGFGLVITEAMSQGLPVITTDRTAGPDLIDHNENGWIIPAGSTSDLQFALENILMKPGIVKEAGNLALEKAGKRPWEFYGKDLIQAVLQN